MGAAPSLEALRARIRAIEGVAPVQRRRVTCEVEAVEGLVEGLPCPGILEVSGVPGSGRTRLALSLVAAQTRQRRAVAWIGAPGAGCTLHPPTASTLGVALERLLLVDVPPVGGNPEVWAAEQVLRSGCFGLVVVALGIAPPRARAGWGHTWARAAEHGRCTAVVLVDRPLRPLPADVRLATSEGRLTVLRDRGRPPGAEAALAWPEACCPWAQ